MKWYNFEEMWIDLEKVCYITCDDIKYVNGTTGLEVKFHFGDHYIPRRFTAKERDAQFAKIKKLMGIKQEGNYFYNCYEIPDNGVLAKSVFETDSKEEADHWVDQLPHSRTYHQKMRDFTSRCC